MPPRERDQAPLRGASGEHSSFSCSLSLFKREGERERGRESREKEKKKTKTQKKKRKKKTTQDALAAAAAPAVLAVAFYSRSCGTCKETLAAWEDAAAEAGASGAGVIFLKHDVRDDFDEATDLARMHRVRAGPSLLFFAGGAAVSRVTLADARVVAPLPGGRDGADRRARLRAALQAVLFRETPSARR